MPPLLDALLLNECLASYTLMLRLKSVTSQVENGCASRRSLAARSFPYAKRRSMNRASFTNAGVPKVSGTVNSRQ